MKKVAHINAYQGRVIRLPKGAYDWSKVTPPPAEWFVRTRRGAIYEAVGEREITASDSYADYFIRDMVAVKVTSAANYLRPGTKRHRYAQEVLDGPDITDALAAAVRETASAFEQFAGAVREPDEA